MLTKKLESLFLPEKLLETLERYKNSSDYLLVKESILNGSFVNNLQSGYIPDPLRSFEIPKTNGEMRQLAQAATASKIIQKIIADELSACIKLNDKSYAFREGKGPLKAINRTKDFLRTYTYVAKVDIDDFFDSIDQDKLMVILDKIITDKRVIMLISLFFQNGMLKQNRWVDKTRGIYQGDVLSPILSNIYLHSFDTMLENEKINFVRYADDMVFFAMSAEEAKSHLSKAASILNALSLRFGDDKSYIASVKDGFEFLGLRFKGDSVTMDNDRFMNKLSTLSQKSKKITLVESVEFFNDYLQGLKQYYAKALSRNDQLILIEEHIRNILIRKIVDAKANKSINNKSKFMQILFGLDDLAGRTSEEKKHYALSMIAKAYESLALVHPMETAKRLIEKKKSNFLQDQAKSSEIVLAKYGLYASISKGKIIVKEYGKVVKKSPINWVSRIIVMTKGATLSTALIYECSKRKIDIDFIENQTPYAQVTYFHTINNELHLKQLEIKNSESGLAIAKALIKAKVKNQLNLIKYHSRYRAQRNIEEFQKLTQIIIEIEQRFQGIEKAKDNAMLMGYEGSISTLYWRAFGLLIGDENFTRTTKDAPDAVNQALNYGYALLYARVQSALIKCGINIYNSFLHEPQDNKPTLVYDIIEPFRQPTVDREIISILNLGTQIVSSKGRLDKESLRVVTENVQERLATPTKYKDGKYKMSTIIEEQALELAHTIKGIRSRFKPYLARY